MPGRHRTSAGRIPIGRSRLARTPLVIAIVALMATGLLLVLQNLADAGGCSDSNGIRLSVAADPAIEAAVREIADDWAHTAEPEIDGRCVAVDVTAAATADVAGALATAAGGFIDIAAPAPIEGTLPAVWIPDSSYWPARLQMVSRSLFAPNPTPLAASPILLAVSPAASELLGSEPVSPSALREPVLAALAHQQPTPLRLAQPRRDTTGVVGASWLHAAVVNTDDELPHLVGAYRRLGDAPVDGASLLADFDARRRPASSADDADPPLVLASVSEQAVIRYNRETAATPISTIPVIDAPSLDFPYTVLAHAPRDVQTAALMLRTALLDSKPGFQQHGFRDIDASMRPVGPVEQLAPALRIWSSATRHARVLSVVNVNSSMAQPMGPARRIDIFQATAQQGMLLFTDESKLGHWEYADQWREGVPIAPLTEEHRQAIGSAITAMQVQPTEESALFEALLAGYQEMKDGYDRTRSNTLILWTDQGNESADLTLSDTLRELERLADVTRPVRVILLGLGPDADMEQLNAIAQATGGGAFHIEDPAEIELVFLRALLT